MITKRRPVQPSPLQRIAEKNNERAERYRRALESITQLKQVTFNQSPELHMALEIARKALAE